MTEIFVASDDPVLLDELLNKDSVEAKISVADSVQKALNEPAILDNNAIIIYDVDSHKKDTNKIVEQLFDLKDIFPTQVIFLVGTQSRLKAVLKQGIQPLVYRAFAKPVHANQMALAYASAQESHMKLVHDHDIGEDPDFNLAREVALPPTEPETSTSGRIVYTVTGLTAILLTIWFFLRTDSNIIGVLNEDNTNFEKNTVEITVSEREKQISRLNKLARTALREGRLIAPEQNNALHYFEQIIAMDAYNTHAYQGKKQIAEKLRNSYSGFIKKLQFERAEKIISILENIDPINPGNQALRSELEKAISRYAKKTSASGSSNEIATATVMLQKLEPVSSASRSAIKAFREEKQILAQIDNALESDRILPPLQDNAYSIIFQALGSNSVSQANISPRINSLYDKLASLLQQTIKQENLEESKKLLALITQPDIDKIISTSLYQRILILQKELASKEQQKRNQQESEFALESEKSRIKPPKLIQKVAPKYPNRALSKNLEGWIKLQFDVDHLGTPINIRIAEASHKNMFDTVAVRAVKKWKFSPALNESTGEAVQSGPIITKLEFKLEK